MGKYSKEDLILIEELYQDLDNSYLRDIAPENRTFIRKAFDFACKAHEGIKRKSGEPYITHPIEVARIVGAEIGLGTKSIVAALLHDVIEDTDYTKEDLAKLFGNRISNIVEGLTKLSEVFDSSPSLQAENFKKMLLTLSDDIRVILIKLADRLHNMRTLQSMPPRKQYKICGETLYLFAPLAHRMGLYEIKTELEDLSLKYEHPEKYSEIKNELDNYIKDNVDFLEEFKEPIINSLNRNGIKYSISERQKSIYSIWHKMNKKNVSFEEVYDLIGYRIIFEPDNELSEKNQCWNIYSLITDIYRPKPERIRDWVSIPKSNGYEALHATIMGPRGRWVEVQIRTQRMNDIAEKGFASHWKYKSSDKENELDKWLKDIREFLDRPENDAIEFLDNFRLNLFSQEIQVFTPKGEIITLPKNSTILDFAYQIHTDVGNNCMGAKVNKKLVPLNQILSSGDQVEILTSEKQKPRYDWINFANTAKAKTEIKRSFRKERKKFIEKGKEILETELRNIKLTTNSSIIRKLTNHFVVLNKEDLFCKIGQDIIELIDLDKILKKKSQNKFIRYWKLQLFGLPKRTKPEITNKNIDRKKTLIIDDDNNEIKYEVAACCNPIPGDEIVAFNFTLNKVTIHKRNCPHAIKYMSNHGDKIVDAKWTTQKIMSFLTKIKLEGIDKIGVVNEVTNIISKEHNVNMQTIHFDSNNGIFEGEIHLYVQNTEILNNLIFKLIKIKGLDNVKRID